MSIHNYFDRTYIDWNVRGFLNECEKEPFQVKVDTYLKSLESIARSDKGKRREKAQRLIDRYKKGIRPPDYQLAKNWEAERKSDKMCDKPSINIKNSTLMGNARAHNIGTFNKSNFVREEGESSIHRLRKCRDEETTTPPTKKTKTTNKTKIKVITEQEQSESKTEVADEKKNKLNELFGDMKSRNIYILCEPFRPLSEVDAEDSFEMIAQDTSVGVDLPKDIQDYLCCLFRGDIKNALSEVEKPLDGNARPLMLWTREVCRHFLFYYYYNALQIDGDEKTWSNQTVYRILDLFSMFFGKLTSGIALRGNKNDAVLYQDDNATILYEQSYGPTEFDTTHYIGDITKLARNGVDDLNYHFLQYCKCSTTTAKKLKSVGIHGYKYFISIYLTDLIFMKTYRTYEIFKCQIPTSFTNRWHLAKIVMIGVYLETLLTVRQSVKGEMGMEDTINDDGPDCVRNWMEIPNNTPKYKRTK